jgi:immunity protein 8 of polymorphic toxin system
VPGEFPNREASSRNRDSVRVRLKGFHSPDVFDLRDYVPAGSDKFGFLIELLVGSDEGGEADIIGAVICRPRWLAQKYKASDAISGYHKIIVLGYDYERLWAYVEAYCKSVEEPMWQAVAARVGKLGMWEFADMNRGLLGP